MAAIAKGTRFLASGKKGALILKKDLPTSIFLPGSSPGKLHALNPESCQVRANCEHWLSLFLKLLLKEARFM